jgi:hypothetical protein
MKMNFLRKKFASLSLVAAVALTPISGFALANGMAAGSSESTSALIEPANVERQLNRINDGINIIRVNNIVLFDMPVSQDAKWVDEVVAPISLTMQQRIDAAKHIQNDPYYSTVQISNLILGQPTITKLTPVGYQLHHRIVTLFKNELSGYDDENYKLPNLYALPSISDLKTYTHFPYDKNVQLIDVEGLTGTVYDNASDATIALLPDDLQEEVIAAGKEYKEKMAEYLEQKGKLGAIEAWLKDDKNGQDPSRAEQEEALAVKKEEVKQAEAIADEKEEIFFQALEKGALAVEMNFDSSKVQLAQKLDKLFESVDSAAVGALSLFTSATAHLMKNGFASLSDEVQAITAATAVASLVWQKDYLTLRLKRLSTNAIYALPNIGIGSYYAYRQIRLAGKYQQIVDKVIEGHEAALEAQEAQMQALEEAQETQENVETTPQTKE